VTETSRTETVTITRNDVESRYDIAVDGVQAGFTVFIDRTPAPGGQRIFPHTELDDAFSGRGLSAILVRQALDDTRLAGQRIVPVCPLIVRFVAKHHDWDDIVDKATPETIAFLESLD